jgi:hypothetical protein
MPRIPCDARPPDHGQREGIEGCAVGRYFVRIVDAELLPDGQPWCFLDDGGDAYFVVSRDGCELTPEVLEHCFSKVQQVYARPSVA